MSTARVLTNEDDATPWVSSTGFRTAEQAWHPVHGLSQFRPRCTVHDITDCSPLGNGCSRVINQHKRHNANALVLGKDD